MILAYIAIGGAIGSICRYLFVSKIAKLLIGNDFPYGVLMVNILGSLLMGVLIEVLARTNIAVSQELRAFFAVGILGGFTTFSSFSLDALVLIERGDFSAALLYITASIVLSLIGIFAGMYGIRMVMGGV